MNKLNFQLVTPEKTVLLADLDSLSCPTDLGQITILPGHIPLVSNLVPGELITRNGNTEQYLNVAGGVIEVRPANEVVILADVAEHHYEIDLAKAEEAKKRAQQAMREETLSDEEYAKVAASLERSLARINIARKHAHKRQHPITSEGLLNE